MRHVFEIQQMDRLLPHPPAEDSLPDQSGTHTHTGTPGRTIGGKPGGRCGRREEHFCGSYLDQLRGTNRLVI